MPLDGAVPRSDRAEVRNPLLTLPATREILALPRETRAPLVALLRELAADADRRAQHAWRTRKAPMAAYWKAVAVYAKHAARVFGRGAA